MPKTKVGYLIDDSFQGEYFTNEEPLPEFGGKGSGNYGHKGQAGGKVGGSGSGGTPKEMSHNGKIVYDFLKLVTPSKTGWLTSAAIAKTMKAKYPNTLNQHEGMQKFREAMLELWKNDEIRISPDGKKWKINEGDKYPFTGEDKDLNPDGVEALKNLLKKDEEKAAAAKEKDEELKKIKKEKAIAKAKAEEEAKAKADAEAEALKVKESDLKKIIKKMQEETGDAVFDQDVWKKVKEDYPETTIDDFRSKMESLHDDGFLKSVIDADGEERIKFFDDPAEGAYQVPEIGANRTAVETDDGYDSTIIFDKEYADKPSPVEMGENEYIDWYNSFKDELSDEERNALYDYQDGDYDEINGVLRGKISEGDEYDYDTISDYESKAETIKSAYDYEEVALRRSTVLYRGTRVRDIEKIYSDFRKGKPVWYQDKGFMSTTISAEVTNNFGGGSKEAVFLEIRAPKGAKVMPLQFNNSYKDEYEVLIPAGKKLKVIGVHRNKTDGTDKHYKFEYKLVLQYLED